MSVVQPCSLFNHVNRDVPSSPPPGHSWFSVGCSSPFMRLAEHLKALGTGYTRCLPGRRKHDVPRPGIVGMRGPMILTLRQRMT